MLINHIFVLTIEQMLYWIALLVLSTALYLFWKYYWKTKSEIKRYKNIFQKLGYIVFEQPYEFMGYSLTIQAQLGLKEHRDARHIQKTVHTQVDVCIGNVLDKASIIFVNPELIKHFISNSNYYQKFEDTIKGPKEIVGNGLIFSEGEEWKNKRKLMSKVFNYDLVKENISKIHQICKKSIDIYQEKGKIDDNKSCYVVCQIAARIFSGMMMKCFFGYDNLDEEVDGIKYGQFMVGTMFEASEVSQSLLVVYLGRYALKLGLTSKLRNIRRRLGLMKQKTMEILQKRKEELQKNPNFDKESSDLTQAFARQKSTKEKGDFQFDDKQLVDQFHTFLTAGTDTTSRFFTMLIYYLGKNPNALKKVREEVMSIIKTDEDVTNQNLKKLIYIDWTQMETTRLFDVANGLFIRIATDDHYIKDAPIKKGTLAWAQSIGNHYSAKNFKDPLEFRPERWEKECDELNPYAYMGFGGGPRSCIGKHLAMLSTKIALVNFVRRYERFEVPEEITLITNFLYEAKPYAATFVKNSK